MAKVEQIEKAKRELDKYKLDYTEHNNGIHLRVVAPNQRIYDFYPTTGRWRVEQISKGIGVNNMLRDMQLI